MDQENQPQKTKYRVSMGVSIVLMTIATVFDGFSLIPFVGDIAAPVFWGGMTIYFWAKGMGILNGRKLAVTAISFTAEMLPAIQELPMLLVGTIAILFIMRVEDKTGLSLVKPMQKGITPPRLTKNPFNGKEGIRPPNQNKQSAKELVDNSNESEPLLDEVNDQKQHSESSSLEDDINKWEKELAILKDQLDQLKQEEKEYRDGYADLIRRKREEGITDDELYKLERGYLMGPEDGGKKTEISNKISNLEKMLFGAKNKLIELNNYNKK